MPIGLNQKGIITTFFYLCLASKIVDNFLKNINKIIFFPKIIENRLLKSCIFVYSIKYLT